MKRYEKPVLVESDILVESVFAGSGDEEIGNQGKRKCRYGRSSFNPGADTCQRCLGGNYIQDIIGKSCPEGL